MKTALFACLVLASLSVSAQDAKPGTLDKDPRNWPYGLQSFARAAGNAGGWWSFMNDNDKAAFLDGYQMGMKQGLSQIGILCTVLRNGVKPSTDQQAFMNQMSAALFVCQSASDFDGFDKVTTADLDDFYSKPVNQPMVVDWTMAYLRDKAIGRKTEGQLLDALNAEQKDVHDCSKYANLCKLGTKE